MTPPSVAVVIVIAAGLLAAAGAEICLQRAPTRRHQPIQLISSPRPSQKMVTMVFRIFLQEFLGYYNVSIVYEREEDDFDGTMVVEKLSERQNKTLKGYANLETWSWPGSVLIPVRESETVFDCGDLLSPPGGRFSWRINNRPEGFDASQFTQANILKEYAFPNTQRDYILKRAERFHPCSSNYSQCALLLASYYNDTSWVVQHITKLKLGVEVAWLGRNFDQVVNELALKDPSKPMLILVYTGDPVAEGLAYHWGTIRFPPCEYLSSNNSEINCSYDLHRLAKVASKKLKGIARPAFEALHKVIFTREEYRELVLIWNNTASSEQLESATCEWVRKNQLTLQTWTLPSQMDKNVVHIGGIFPLSNSTVGKFINAGRIIEAAQLAITAVNNNNTLLQDYNLQLRVSNGNCSAESVMRTFIDYILYRLYERMVGILGPACSDTLEPLAGVNKYYRTVVISYSAEGASLHDREKYPYFFRTISENHQYRLVYLYLLKRFDWNRIATLSEDGQKYTEYISHTQDLLQKHGIHFIANPRFPRGRQSDFTPYLRELVQLRARIIIADVQEDAAVALMCEAYKQNMTAYHGYVWFLPGWLSDEWWKINSTLCKREELVFAIDGYFCLAPRQYASPNQIMQEGISVGQWLKRYNRGSSNSSLISPYGGYAYDAVWVYAYALDALLAEDPTYYDDLHSEKTAQRLVHYISKSDFQGVSGRINFSQGSSRSSEVLIYQWLKNHNFSKREVGSFIPNATSDSGILDLNEEYLRWLTPNGKTPDDGTKNSECVFQTLAEALSLSCEAAIVVVNITGFGFLGIILIILFFIAKKRYERKQKMIMQTLGMEMVSANQLCKSLDKWELPRDRVVINRKLGEGAFGAVYGGEAMLNDKEWVAVAVKTLKPGSSTEVKLDFLSEAEVMKRFDHTNIVKLLGVCTKNEPVYTIMEFMLYGDLKTYLLARRHLVASPSEETEEVSSKRLTTMAIDVARALSYLAEIKYVHRDVACRNCLVNASRLVKLADFGMTRPMFESDYYKFSRKGMLPVRWMAPESLALGIFTPSSDVWSYGVLLYEVMTFGSFPFQGMSNTQVLEHVKNGGTIVVPSGAKPQLEALLKSCWNPDHKKRPQAREIVEFLANNPRLLSPCLDAPIASVQLEEPQGEFPLPESFRKVSISLRRRLNSSATEPLIPLPGSPQTSTAAEEDDDVAAYCNP